MATKVGTRRAVPGYEGIDKPHPMTVAMPPLHPGQWEVHSHPARYKVVACGRRWGKTRWASAEILANALGGGSCWWVAPAFPIAEIGWRMIRAMATKVAQQMPGVVIRESNMRIEFPSGGWLQVKSADKPLSLVGEGLSLVVMDEASLIHETAWTNSVRPALVDRKGKAIFVFTPRGHNWVWRLWKIGQLSPTDPGYDPEWKSFQKPTSDNPHLPDVHAELAKAAKNMAERIFQQEHLAAFIQDAGGVFKNVAACMVAPWNTPRISHHTYVMGVDWGKTNDFTVLTMLDMTTHRMVDFFRINRIDYAVQMSALHTMYSRWKPQTMVVEQNSIGVPLIEELLYAGYPVIPFNTQNRSKDYIIQSLVVAFQQNNIEILPIQELVDELQAYEYNITPSGLTSYSAPEGAHDDCVISLALAWAGTDAVDSPPEEAVYDDRVVISPF